MTLEDQLRQVFTAQVEDIRALDDPAGRAIRRARKAHRRRTVGAGLTAALAVLVSLGGTVVVRDGWQREGRQETTDESLDLPVTQLPPPSPTPMRGTVTKSPLPAATLRQLRALGVDLRVRNELWTMAGQRFALTGVSRVTRLYQVPAGWVYSDDDHAWLLGSGGAVTSLGALGRQWLLSPDGTRLAYISAGKLTVDQIRQRGAVPGRAVSVPENAHLVAFAGEHVVISAKQGGIFGTVRLGESEPVWTEMPLTVYGAAGEEVVGVIHKGEGSTCLVRLAVVKGELTATRSGACRPRPGPRASYPSVPDKKAMFEAKVTTTPTEPSGDDGPETNVLPADPLAVLAPDGGWLAETMGGELVLTRVPDEIAKDPPPVLCPVEVAPVTHAWANDTTLLAYDARGIAQCRTDGRVAIVPLPAGLNGTDWAFVPRLNP